MACADNVAYGARTVDTALDGVVYILASAYSLRMLSIVPHSAHCAECGTMLSILRLPADPEI